MEAEPVEDLRQHEVGVRVVLADGAQELQCGRAWQVGHLSTSPSSSRAPRAQSAAGISRLPGGRTRPSRTGTVAVPTWTSARPMRIRPAGSAGASGAGSTRPEPESLVTPGAPRPGCRRAGAHLAVGGHRRHVPAHTRVVDGQLRCVGRIAGLRHRVRRAGLERVERRQQEPGPGPRQPLEEVAGRVPWADGLGEGAVHRAGVQPLLQGERRGAGDVVAAPDGVLDRCGPSPRRQQREVQVDPAVDGDPQRLGRDEPAVGHHGRAVRRQGRQPREDVGLAQRRRLQDLESRLGGEGGHRRGDDAPSAARGGIRAGEDGDHVVRRGDELGQCGGSHLRRSCEDAAHGVRASARRWCAD